GWADVLRSFRPNAVTDVTGFGLLGHAHEMAERSDAQLVLEAAQWPALYGALEVARADEKTGGDRRNRDFAEAHVTVVDGVADELGARLRALARVPAGPAVPGEGVPLLHRVRQPDGRRRDDRPHACIGGRRLAHAGAAGLGEVARGRNVRRDGGAGAARGDH